MGELGLRLHDFYDMPWCEYLLKSIAYRRKEEEEWGKVKYVTWHILSSSMSIDAKKLPSLHKFMTGEERSVKKASDALKSQYLKEYEEYLAKVKKEG